MSFAFAIFVFILMIGGWIISEIIAKNEKEIEQQYSKRLKQLKKEKSVLIKSLTKVESRRVGISEECDSLKSFEAEIPSLKKNNKHSSNELVCLYENINTLRVKLQNREYYSNPLADEALNILKAYFPNKEEQKANKQERVRGAFDRIKNSID